VLTPDVRCFSLPTKVAAALAVAVLMFASVPADAQRAPSTKRAAKNEAPAPEDDQGMAAAPQAAITRGNVPVNAELTALTPPYKSFANVEYQPKNAPPEGALVKDIMGLNTQTATDCAKKCTATKGCNAVTWVGANTAYIGPSNCWLKTISVPCVLPVYAEAYPDTFLLMQQTPGCAPSSSWVHCLLAIERTFSSVIVYFYWHKLTPSVGLE
jgi:hypothetical protein